jgi:YVTN family beta-propeller protein
VAVRRSLEVFAICSFLTCLLPAVEAGTLYVTNSGSGTLAVLDESSLAVRATIPVGERPWGVAVAADGKRACVSYAQGLAIVNLQAGAVAQRVALGGQGMGVAISRDGAVCYVAVHRADGDRLVAVEVARGRLRGKDSIGERAFGVYLSPDGRTLYVPEHDAFTMSVLDAATLAKGRTILLTPLDEGAFDKPHYLAMSPDGATLYLPFQGRALVVIDTSAWTVTSHPLAINAHQHGIAISPDGRRLYLANNVFGGAGSLSEIDTKTFQELRRIPLGKDHEQVALDPVGRRVYLTGGFALGGHDELTVVDLATGAVTRAATGGTRPFAILRVP